MRHRILHILVSVILLLAGGYGAAAQNVKDKQSRKARLEQEIAILDRQIRQNKSRNEDALARLSLIQTKIATRQALVSESDAEIEEIEGRMAAKQQEIDVIQARLDTITAYSERLVRSAYKNRDARVWYMYILASENIGQGLRRFSFFRNLSSKMNDQAVKIRQTREALQAEQDKLEKMRAEASVVREARVRELDSLRKEEQEVKSLSASLQRDRSRYQKDMASKRRQADALEQQIRKAISSAIGSGKASSKSKTISKPRNPVDYKLADEFVANRGKLPWPVDEGAVVGRFGKQYHSVFTRLQMPVNNGITLAVSPDAPVKAVFNGTVAQITVLPGYHQCILVQHGNYFTLYSKMKTVKVKAGDKVTTGQVLGTVDTISGETVFHFEIWDDRTVPQNPELWLRPL